MKTRTRILALAGSTRAGSWNHLLIENAAAGARRAGAEVTVVRLRDYPLPLFDEDLEAAGGLPEPGRRLRTLFAVHDGLLLASPEYNGSVTAVLKNTLDWLSRGHGGEPPLSVFKGRTAALLSASPGGLGGLRGLVHARAILGNLGLLVLPEQLALPAAHEAFDAAGRLRDRRRQAEAEALGARLAEVTARLGTGPMAAAA